MSVVKYESKFFYSMAKNLADLAHACDAVKYAVIRSQAFLLKTKLIQDKPEEKQMELVISWMIDNLNKANAYAVHSQYGECPDFEDCEDWEDWDLVTLERKMRSLDYNLADNCGNMFVEPVYYEMFKGILHAIHRDSWDRQHDESERY